MFQKLIYRSNKTGYLQIDFAFAILVFFMFFFFIYSTYNSYDNNFKKAITYALIEVDSRDLCSFLIANSGQPYDWEGDIDNVDFLGMRSYSNYSLDHNKIVNFNNLNYNLIIDKLNMDDYNMYISIRGLISNSNYLDFGISSENLAAYVSSNSCFSNYNNEPVVVYLEVWK